MRPSGQTPVLPTPERERERETETERQRERLRGDHVGTTAVTSLYFENEELGLNQTQGCPGVLWLSC
jgi:hypothetical protein